MSTLVVFVILGAFFLGGRVGMYAANRRSAFRRGYIHGWYDAKNIDDWLLDNKTELFEDGTLPIVGEVERW